MKVKELEILKEFLKGDEIACNILCTYLKKENLKIKIIILFIVVMVILLGINFYLLYTKNENSSYKSNISVLLIVALFSHWIFLDLFDNSIKSEEVQYINDCLEEMANIEYVKVFSKNNNIYIRLNNDIYNVSDYDLEVDDEVTIKQYFSINFRGMVSELISLYNCGEELCSYKSY